MGLADVFGAEDRVELTVAQLIKILTERANAVEDFNTAMAMCETGINSETINKVFAVKKERTKTNAE